MIEAAERTLEASPARVESTVSSGDVRYELDGRLDPAGGGYRLCAVIGAAPSDYVRGRSLWLDGRAGTYATLTARDRRCGRHALWLDDHPPTLDLHEGEDISPPGVLGAEDFLHAALVGLIGLRDGTVIAAQARACGRSTCYRTDVDFEALDQKPRERDEDGWTLRRLLRSLARHPVTVRVDPDGFVDRLSLDAPGSTPSRTIVRVAFGLSAFGKEDPVPLVHASAIE